MDNCGRENKNRFVLLYLCYLVLRKTFAEVTMNFLQVGHTHNDVDALFFLIANEFIKSNAVSIEDIHAIVKKSLAKLIKSEHYNTFPNFKDIAGVWSNKIAGTQLT